MVKTNGGVFTSQMNGENDENSSELANSGGAGSNSLPFGSGHILGGSNNINQAYLSEFDSSSIPHHFEPFSSFDFQPNLL